MNSTFDVTAAQKIQRSVFDLSHQKLLTGDLGKLYPVMCLEALPGDVFDISHEVVVRFNPMVSPVLHEINMYIHTFFVPNRIMWENDDPVSGNWEDFITGGEDGTDAPALPTFDPGAGNKTVGSLWDYLGYPTDASTDIGDGIDPVAFPSIAYATIYNEWFRDQTHVTEVAKTNNTILKRAWERDYTTSALPWQQRGTTPALPISGVIDVAGQDANITVEGATEGIARILGIQTSTEDLRAAGFASGSSENMRWTDPQLEVDLSGATTFDVSDLRLAVQQQRILELNARAGSRYVEWLQASFRISPNDARLDVPEFIGSIRAPVIVSEVLQTSETNTTAQGTMAGHGISVDQSRIGRYRCEEFGIVMSILSVMPRAVYSQGIDRNWIKSTRWDYYHPALAHLSEQAVVRGEIYANATSADNNTVFGYQGRFNELRYQKSSYAGKMRVNESFDHWHIGRNFSSAPSLNQTYIECDPKKDWLAASTEDAMIVSVGNRVSAARPLPVMSDPGLLDH